MDKRSFETIVLVRLESIDGSMTATNTNMKRLAERQKYMNGKVARHTKLIRTLEDARLNKKEECPYSESVESLILSDKTQKAINKHIQRKNKKFNLWLGILVSVFTIINLIILILG